MSALMKKLTEFDKTCENAALLDLIFMGFESFCNQIGFEENLRKLSFRILMITFRAAALFVIPVYGAEITSYLALREAKVPFDDVYEFVEHGQYILAIYGGTFVRFYLAVSFI